MAHLGPFLTPTFQFMRVPFCVLSQEVRRIFCSGAAIGAFWVGCKGSMLKKCMCSVVPYGGGHLRGPKSAVKVLMSPMALVNLQVCLEPHGGVEVSCSWWQLPCWRRCTAGSQHWRRGYSMADWTSLAWRAGVRWKHRSALCSKNRNTEFVKARTSHVTICWAGCEPTSWPSLRRSAQAPTIKAIKGNCCATLQLSGTF